MVARVIDLKILAQTDDARRQLDIINARADAIGKLDPTIKVRVDRSAVTQGLAVLNAETKKLASDVTMKVNADGLVTATAKTKAATDALNVMTVAGTRGGGAWGILGTKVSLFGGVLTRVGVPAILATAGGLHLIIDAAIETAAVVAPAAIAFGAFGAAAVPNVQAIVAQMTNLNTVSTALGVQMPGLSGGFQKAADAVQPQVYQLFGDALDIANQKGSVFIKLAQGAGTVLDQLGARLTVAVTGGKGFNQFLADAVPDLAKIGDLIGNLGGVFGNLMKTMPGYAQVLLNVADGFTRALEAATGNTVVQHVINAGLLMHGALLYVGLGATVAAKAVSGGLGLIGNLATKAGDAAIASNLLGTAGDRAGMGLKFLGAGAADAAALPWGFIAVAAVAVGILAYKLLTAKDATQQWLQSLQNTLNAAGAVRGFTLLQQDQVLVAQHLAVAQTQLGAAASKSNDVWISTGKTIDHVNPVLGAAQQKVSDLTQGQIQLNDQSALYGTRLARLSVAFGGTGAAMGIMNAAGITMNQMLNYSDWPQIVAQVDATAAAYREMGQTGGILGADMNALNITASDQVTSMQKLNTAWDGVIGIVSGGQNSFIAFEQAADTAAHAVGGSMGGLDTASLTLRADWQTMFGAGSTLIDSLRMMQSASPGGFPSVTQAMKLTLDQMLPLGKQTGATRAEMVTLAQEINPAITNFRQLTTWLGNVKDPAQKLNDLVSKMGINLQDLATDAANLSSNLKTDVINQFNLAKIAAGGVGTAIHNLATAMTDSHPSAQLIQTDAQTLYDKLRNVDGMSRTAATDLVTTLDPAFRNTGSAADRAAGFVSGLVTQLGKIKPSYATQITANAAGTGTITYKEQGAGGLGLGASLHFMAGGGRVTGGMAGRDSVLIAAMPGEVVIPAGMVAGGAVDHLRGRLPGFARGGLVDPVTAPAAFVASAADNFLATGEHAFAQGVLAAFNQAASAAVGALAGVGGGVTQWAAVANQVLHLLEGPGQLPGDLHTVLAQMTTESRGNPLAVNRTDSNWLAGHPSVGLMQVIAGTFDSYAGPYRATGPFEYGVSVNPLANIYAGMNYAIGRYGPGWRNVLGHGHGYDSGGYLPRGLSLAMNNTGHAEAVMPAAKLDDIADAVDNVAGLISQLIGVTAQGPAVMGAAMAGGARSAAYRSLYP